MTIRHAPEMFASDNFDPDEFSREQEELRKKQGFKDFLIASEISGKTTGVPHSKYIPSEFIVNSGNIVEISQDALEEAESETHSPKPATVIVRKNPEGEIISIIVECSCGEKTTIMLETGEELS
jgi:hypothetical protein